MDDHKANMKNSLVQNRDFGKLILPLAVIGLMLRAAYLTARPIWYDEAITIFFAQSGISYIGQHFWHGSNPPLAYFIYAAWGYVFGPSQMSYEWVSVLFGAASLYWIYRTGKTLFDEQAGFFALLLLAFSSYHLFVSQQIRSYSMTCFFVLLSIEQLFRYYQTGKRINLWGWIAGSLLMLASHFYTVFLFAVEIGFLLIHLVDPARKKINTARNIYGGLAAFLLAFLIAIYPILHKHGVFQFYPRPFAGLGDLLLTLQSVLFLSKPLVVLSLGLVAWCLYQGMRKGSGNEFHLDHRRAVHFLCVWVLISLTIPFLFSQFVPSFFYVRYYIFTHLAWVLLTAFSISRIRQESVRAAVAAIFIFMLSLLIGDYYRECQEKKELKLILIYSHNPFSLNIFLLPALIILIQEFCSRNLDPASFFQEINLELFPFSLDKITPWNKFRTPCLIML